MVNMRAFSLVELSIVLVILGLLVGGILAGQSLVRASELRAVSSEQAKYTTAVHAFRDRYFALPGDFMTAASVWPAASNGNGNGLLQGAGSLGVPAEIFQFWYQLTLAGLIEGTYSGLTVATGSYNAHIPGTNVPASKMSSGGWSVVTRNNYAGDGAWYVFNYGQMFAFGATDTTDLTRASILKPEEAWNIDTKMDDGNPLGGRVIATFYNGCTTKTDGTTSAAADTTGIYNLPRTAASCALAFTRAF